MANAKMIASRADGKSSFDDAVNYITEDAKGDSHYLHNIDDKDFSASEMTASATLSTLCNDPVEHMAISWPEGEEPTDDQCFEAGRMMLKAVRCEDHQAVMAVHRNTDNVHIHVVFNRVHHIEGKAQDMGFYKREMSKCCREIEIRQGWSHTDAENALYIVGIDENGNKIPIKNPDRDGNEPLTKKAVRDGAGANKFETQTGNQSFKGYVLEELQEPFYKALEHDAAKTWDDVHRVAAKRGVTLQARGGGMVLVDSNSPDDFHMKASELGKWSSRGKFEKKLGPFQAPSDKVISQAQQASLRYDPNRSADKFRADDSALSKNNDGTKSLTKRELRAAERAQKREVMNSQFSTEKKDHYKHLKIEKKAEWDTQRSIEKMRWNALLERRRDTLKEALPKTPRGEKQLLRGKHALETAMLKDHLYRVRDQEREELKNYYADSRFPSKRDWLKQQIELGTDHAETAKSALNGMKHQKSRDRLKDLNSTASLKPIDTLDVDTKYKFGEHRQAEKESVFKDLEANYDNKSKVISYKRADENVFVDQGMKIKMESLDDRDVEAAFLISKEKFRKLQITGSVEYRKKIAQLAVKHNVDIGNPEMQPYMEKLKKKKAVLMQRNKRYDKIRSETEQMKSETDRSLRDDSKDNSSDEELKKIEHQQNRDRGYDLER